MSSLQHVFNNTRIQYQQKQQQQNVLPFISKVGCIKAKRIKLMMKIIQETKIISKVLVKINFAEATNYHKIFIKKVFNISLNHKFIFTLYSKIY